MAYLFFLSSIFTSMKFLDFSPFFQIFNFLLRRSQIEFESPPQMNCLVLSLEAVFQSHIHRLVSLSPHLLMGNTDFLDTILI